MAGLTVSLYIHPREGESLDDRWLYYFICIPAAWNIPGTQVFVECEWRYYNKFLVLLMLSCEWQEAEGSDGVTHHPLTVCCAGTGWAFWSKGRTDIALTFPSQGKVRKRCSSVWEAPSVTGIWGKWRLALTKAIWKLLRYWPALDLKKWDWFWGEFTLSKSSAVAPTRCPTVGLGSLPKLGEVGGSSRLWRPLKAKLRSWGSSWHDLHPCLQGFRGSCALAEGWEWGSSGVEGWKGKALAKTGLTVSDENPVTYCQPCVFMLDRLSVDLRSWGRQGCWLTGTATLLLFISTDFCCHAPQQWEGNWGGSTPELALPLHCDTYLGHLTFPDLIPTSTWWPRTQTHPSGHWGASGKARGPWV